MTELTEIKQEAWRYMNRIQSGQNENALSSFAYDDTFCEAVGVLESDPIVHTWVHQPTIVLGTQDTRLQDVFFAKEHLEKAGYTIIVRNSGGLAVMLDSGVLNISLIFKDQKSLSIDPTYELMFNLIQQMYSDAPYPIEAKEVVGSYCPGNYDLSMQGKKFAGISQRRLRNGTAVQIYLAITGSGSERATTIQQFYSLAEQTSSETTMTIEPYTMASLSELYGQPLTVQDGENRLINTFNMLGKTLQPKEMSVDEQQRLTKRLKMVYERNDKILYKS
ncbi:octanoyl-[GcvH]:protein N-octanoyltransferase [Geomicrobium sediminis]|uniref:Octanoyl-[GcvH]:protein N-octanoyltransferase n=2 Tax=Geomicrobium sediminis TaxID=1347788 RepID=A0ABS2PGL0_9BACL|nr:lipoate--protein ligase family protein [Geomicrobium sediminis]MBM7634469.1 octanoyl-[GcvH]:protein N-octanoyltransferase [Geomicrobium sediminis]